MWSLRTETYSGTFSVLARSMDSRVMGVAVASGSSHVGDRVPHAMPGIGLVATQADTNVVYGIRGLELLSKGLTPQNALEKLLSEDSERDRRQVAIMDFKGRKAVFTGADSPAYHAEVMRKDYVIIGNLLSSREVIGNMAKQFESSSGPLAWRIAVTLKVGSESGGDKRGEKSAALIAVGTNKVELEIKVNTHKKPIDELLSKLKTMM